MALVYTGKVSVVSGLIKKGIKTKALKKKMGRPKKEIDQKAFEGLCGIQCTRQEVCQFFDISDKTLDKWCKATYGKTFSVIFSQKRVAGKVSLRRNMFALSKTSAAMSIFMCKNWLGMKDKPDGDEVSEPLPVSITIQVEDATKQEV